MIALLLQLRMRHRVKKNTPVHRAGNCQSRDYCRRLLKKYSYWLRDKMVVSDRLKWEGGVLLCEMQESV